MKTIIFVVAGFFDGTNLASQFYEGGPYAFSGGLVGAFVGWVFSGVGQKR